MLARQLFSALDQVTEAHQVQVIEAFAEQLVEKRLRRLLPRILQAVEAELNVRDGVVKSQVITPKKLSSADLQHITQNLEKVMESKLEISTRVVPELIGGAIIQLGDTIFDGSVRTSLAKLKQNIETYG